jgi:Macrocin-O-methyltransferase (TylF)
MARFDRTVHPDSKIAKLPGFLQPSAVLVRNIVFFIRPPVDRLKNYHHRLDGIATRHNDGFRKFPRFNNAYDRAVAASGWDYNIPYRIHQALWCSHQAQKVEGDFVELGTGRGFIMSAVLADYPAWNQGSRALHLFDTFKSTWPDQFGRQTTAGEISGYYAESVTETMRNFSEWQGVYFYEGDVFKTLPRFQAERVAFIHIDLNFHEPEVFGLKSVWERIPRGGIVLLDDYAFHGHERQYEAMNELAAELGVDILSTPTGQGIIIK